MNNIQFGILLMAIVFCQPDGGKENFFLAVFFLVGVISLISGIFHP